MRNLIFPGRNLGPAESWGRSVEEEVSRLRGDLNKTAAQSAQTTARFNRASVRIAESMSPPPIRVLDRKEDFNFPALGNQVWTPLSSVPIPAGGDTFISFSAVVEASTDSTIWLRTRVYDTSGITLTRFPNVMGTFSSNASYFTFSGVLYPGYVSSTTVTLEAWGSSGGGVVVSSYFSVDATVYPDEVE